MVNVIYIFIGSDIVVRVINNVNELVYYEYGVNLVFNCIFNVLIVVDIGVIEK